jgi:hypothetical protein
LLYKTKTQNISSGHLVTGLVNEKEKKTYEQNDLPGVRAFDGQFSCACCPLCSCPRMPASNPDTASTLMLAQILPLMCK